MSREYLRFKWNHQSGLHRRAVKVFTAVMQRVPFAVKYGIGQRMRERQLPYTLIKDARFETDLERQLHLWNQGQIRILHEMAALPLLYTLQNYARKTWLDYGHPLESSMALYPQFTENTSFRVD